VLVLAHLLVFCRCEQRVNCRWGSYGEWSECDGCARSKVRTRHIAVYAQFGGTPCAGSAAQTVSCIPDKTCPLEMGCGDRFRCASGLCISQSLVCNGDQDCEDGLDERRCDQSNGSDSCDLDKTLPNSELTGRGYNVLTGELRAGVINTRSFGGQCRKVFSGDHQVLYRLPQNILRYNFEVHVNNEESDESYDSSWTYMQHIQTNALVGHDRRTFHKELSDNKSYRLLVLKNRVELAQFQNSAPEHLALAEGFWKELLLLPLTYDYSAYRQLLQTYGTHYLSEGSLGGEYQALLQFDRQAFTSSSTTDIEYQRCWRKVKRRLFRKKITITCEKLTSSLSSNDKGGENKFHIKTNTVGGDPSLTAALSVLDLENPETNGENYDNWASSVKDYPDVIAQKLRPLYELVKEVQCSGLKKLNLKRATEDYLSEEHPCHCRPCRNNGQPLLTGSVCRCVCRPGTSGSACERGAVIGEQPGVIHGSWSCWSAWASCSGGQRSRTRSCNNPSPSRGGQHCVGPELEQTQCEDSEIQHLQMMEPQCFGLSVSSPKTCGLPPSLRNGFILDPKDLYLVGSRVQYSCIDGFYLSGNALATCTENQTWSRGAMDCKFQSCTAPTLKGGVTATPIKAAYQIGDKVFLSCPQGLLLSGDVTEVTCSSSLQWSPSPAGAQCTAAPTTTPLPPGLRCKPWESVVKAACVCKMPFQCTTSLQLCARIGSGRARLMGTCQLGALQCMGRRFTLVNKNECSWPEEASCADCKQGMSCDGNCPKESHALCVSVGVDSVSMTMTECEVGARRCAGETINVISIDACSQ
uniref:Complement component C7 n=1 Tax=Gouania willdenowi TaxID=441366 RepID=A0A8C5N8Q3_GOUWI